jgi:cation-transporting ATPase E
LAYRASPGRSERYLLPDAAAFVIPAAIMVAAASLTIYLLFGGSTDADLAQARTALTIMSTLCGIALIPVVELDRDEWTNPSCYGRDRRLLATAAVMLLLLGVALVVPPLRRLYELAVLPVTTWLVIAAVFFAWAVALRLVYNARLYERFVAPVLPLRWRPAQAGEKAPAGG